MTETQTVRSEAQRVHWAERTEHDNGQQTYRYGATVWFRRADGRLARRIHWQQG